MKEIIGLSFLSCKESLNRNNRKYCFEIFGFDFLLDILGNPWLIEANTNPCLDEASPILKMLIPRMLGIFYCFILRRCFQNSFGSLSSN